MDKIIEEMLTANSRRHSNRNFDPYTGENSPGERVRTEIDCAVMGKKTLWLPVSMQTTEPGASVMATGSVRAFAKERGLKPENVAEMFELIRLRHDFPYWAAKYGVIRPKRGGENVPIVLNSAQRKLVNELERMRCAGMPIRVILLKARQWGGSTVIQLFMVWLQLVRGIGLNSLVVAHQNVATEDIRAMMKRVVDSYPDRLLRADFEAAERGLLEDRIEKPVKKSRRKGDSDCDDAETERRSPLRTVGRSGNTWHLPERNCDFKIGTAERPDSSRGGSYSLVHLSEVGIWRATEGKSPSEIVVSATSGVLSEPETLVVLESTAKGPGNYFHKEYIAAKKGEAQWSPVFIAWYDIEQYELALEDRAAFARWLFENREDDTSTERGASGRYLWELWQAGATLEAINWYKWERSKYDSASAMASEYPSNDEEAFSASGCAAFPPAILESLQADVHDPIETLDDGFETRIWEQAEPDAEYIVVFYPGMPERGVRITGVVMKTDDPGHPQVVAEMTGNAPIDEAIRSILRLCNIYDRCTVVILADSGDVVSCGHAMYAGEKLSESEHILYLPNKTDRILRITRELKTVAIDTLRCLINKHRWSDPSSEAHEQMQTFEIDPYEGFRPSWGNSDDLLMPRCIGAWLAWHV